MAERTRSPSLAGWHEQFAGEFVGLPFVAGVIERLARQDQAAVEEVVTQLVGDGGRLTLGAREMKQDLATLQASTGIPAAGAVAQFIHESFNPGGLVLSRLAAEFNNLAGLKWASWQAAHGARPVSLATWEEVDGARQDLTDAFAAFPSTGRFLDAYSELLVTASRYRGALAYSGQPLLWLHQVWAGGWATDSRYLGGLGHWMAAIWPEYQNTVPGGAGSQVGQLVPIRDPGGRLLARGWLVDPDGPGPDSARAVCYARDLGDAMGLETKWEPTEPAVIPSWPGSRQKESGQSED